MTKKNIYKDNKSFTLIELMMVVIIVGVLASVAAPMMRKSIIRSKWTEGVVGLGQIRTAERVYYMEYGTYAGFSWGQSAAGLTTLGLRPTDFDGIYFSNNSFIVTVDTFDSTYVACYINSSTAPRANELNFNNGETATLLMNGKLYETY